MSLPIFCTIELFIDGLNGGLPLMSKSRKLLFISDYERCIAFKQKINVYQKAIIIDTDIIMSHTDQSVSLANGNKYLKANCTFAIKS